jgi:hypothetical protein
MIEHLSYSSISSYLACGQAWKYHYLDKVPVPTAEALFFGSAFHSTVETFIGNNHEGEILSDWDMLWKRQLEVDPKVVFETTPEDLYNTGVKMLTAPEIQKGILSIKAATIERKVTLCVPGVPVPVIGYIDVITKDGVPGDFKTSARAWTMDKALGELQPVFYLAALNQAGEPVQGGRFRHYVFVKTKEPKFQMLEHAHSTGEMFWLFKMIKSVWDSINAGVFPLNPTGWKCNPQYCDYWSMCRGKYA